MKKTSSETRREAKTDPPGDGFSALVQELRAALERANELTILLLNRLTLTDLAVLTGEAHLQTHDLEIAALQRRVADLETTAAE